MTFAFCIVLPTHAQEVPRVIVADMENSGKDARTATLRIATDTLAMELTRGGVYDVVARQAVDRAAKARHLEPPYGEQDMAAIAKDVDASLLVTGEIHHADVRGHSDQVEAEVGLIVRVRDLALGELINGSAERGVASAPVSAHRPDVSLIMDATEAAARQAATRIGAYHPIYGTILNTAGRGLVILNRGIGNGVRGKQEFVVLRNGVPVGRLRVFRAYPSYSEMTVLDNTLGIRPEDRAIAVFPEPKFGPRG